MTEALESFAFNVAVARLYELTNAIAEAERLGLADGLGRHAALPHRAVEPHTRHAARGLHSLGAGPGDRAA